MSNPSFLKSVKYHYYGIRGITPIVASCPLYVALIIGLFSKRIDKVFLIVIALACFTTASIITRNFFTALQSQMFLERKDKTLIKDSRPIALVINTIGVAVLAFFNFKSIPATILLAMLGALGYYLNYMLISVNEDLEPKQPPKNPNLPPVLQQMIDDAYLTLNNLRQHSKAIGQNKDKININIAYKLQSIIKKAEFILNKSINKPNYIRSMRSFYIVHLPELDNICQGYRNLNPQLKDPNQDKDFFDLLEKIDISFTSQQISLSDEDERALDVQMKVLKQQLGINQQDKNHG